MKKRLGHDWGLPVHAAHGDLEPSSDELRRARMKGKDWQRILPRCFPLTKLDTEVILNGEQKKS